MSRHIRGNKMFHQICLTIFYNQNGKMEWKTHCYFRETSKEEHASLPSNWTELHIMVCDFANNPFRVIANFHIDDFSEIEDYISVGGITGWYVANFHIHKNNCTIKVAGRLDNVEQDKSYLTIKYR